MIRIEPRNANSAIFSYGVPILSAFIALILASIPLWFAGAPVLISYVEMAKGVFGSKFAFSEMLTRATPLMFTGLAAALAFRAKLWNIGAEGQLYLGAMAAAAIGTGLIEAPAFILLPLIIAFGCAAGSVGMVVPALLKTRYGADEVVTTLLLNFIIIIFLQYMLEGHLKDPMCLDCRVHYNDSNKDLRFDSTLFITEGDSASGSITKTRDIKTQAVFSLRGKPLNCYGLTKKVVYENEEFNLLQSALNIEQGIDDLRYNKIVIATDADVDGMHIRLLLITFFLQFFPELVKEGHVYILETPLFRVRNKKETIYCYTNEERIEALSKLGKNPEITRFKGLGEISPNEFKYFIGENMRLDPVIVGSEAKIQDILKYYMGKNTPQRQEFIINNLKIEEDIEYEHEKNIN